MTCKTSEVAVCCSSDAVSSRVLAWTSSKRRAFSIAITAWSANVVSSAICCSLKGRTEWRDRPNTPIGVPSRSIWGADQAAIAAESLRFAQLVFRIGLRIENLDRCAFEQSSTGHALTPWLEGCLVHLLLELPRKAAVCLDSKNARLVWESDLSHIGLAKADGRLDECVEHCLQIERRSADHLQHVGGRGLLLQRLGK